MQVFTYDLQVCMSLGIYVSQPRPQQSINCKYWLYGRSHLLLWYNRKSFITWMRKTTFNWGNAELKYFQQESLTAILYKENKDNVKNKKINNNNKK